MVVGNAFDQGGLSLGNSPIESEDISVVIPCYTEKRLPNIIAALASLQHQQFPPHAVIVAVDNNETLARKLQAMFDWVTVVVNERLQGASATRNRGVEAVTTKYTAFLDDDEVADRDWLWELTRPLAENNVVGTGGKYEVTWPSGKPFWFPREFEWVVGGSYEGLPILTAPVRNVWSGNMAVRTDVFRSVGGFRNDFGKRGDAPQPEDTDLCIRMAAAGGHWMYVPAATINHSIPRSRVSMGYFLRRCFAEGRGKGLMASNLGSASVIGVERDYAMTVLRVAVVRLHSLRATETSQGFTILLGLTCAASGYLLERARPFSKHARNKRKQRHPELPADCDMAS
ncbi:glycosyltransferase family 2 protein [Mycobacterium sp. NPDC048908]|uniref:glycosyltransferase family 2 protein n=1 Tax=Mycobacterium sp. NPDC048908 TaxID=3364292 RepID=UPI00371C8B2F